MSYQRDVLRVFAEGALTVIARNVVKLVLVSCIIGGWYLMNNGQFWIGVILELVGLSGIDLSGWVVRFIPFRIEE